MDDKTIFALQAILRNDCEDARKQAETIENEEERLEFLKQAFNHYTTELLKLNNQAWKSLIDIRDDDIK